jgi:hypothetical protein
MKRLGMVFMYKKRGRSPRLHHGTSLSWHHYFLFILYITASNNEEEQGDARMVQPRDDVQEIA